MSLKYPAHRVDFLRAVAEYITSDVGRKSIELQMGKADAKLWARAYSLSGCPGYATADEAFESICRLLDDTPKVPFLTK